MNKIIKFMFAIVCILIVLIITFPRYVDHKVDISSKIGDAWHGGTISVTEYNLISRLFDSFFQKLKVQDYEGAFDMTSFQYRVSTSIEEFQQEMNQYNLEGMVLKEIIPLSQHLFQATFVNEEDETQFFIILNENSADIMINNFIETKEYNDSKMKKKHVVYQIIKTENYIDHFVIYLNITNKRNTDVLINNVCLSVNGHRVKEALNENITIPKKMATKQKIEFKTNIEFPSMISFDSYDENGKQIGEISFEL